MVFWCDGKRFTNSITNAIFFCTGKFFCLRGGEEHRNLKLPQFERLTDPDRYIYHENCSKNKSGTFRQLHVVSKVVPIYCTCQSDADRCYVHLLDMYIAKLPEKIRAGKGLFYVRPLQCKPVHADAPWFCDVPVGRNTL